MSILKKSLSFILSGAIAASTSISTLFIESAAFTVSPDTTDSILNNKKGYHTTACLEENTSLSSSYNYRKLAYDVWAKIDTTGYTLNTTDYESVTTELDEYLTGVTAEFTNPDGSMVQAEVLDFEQKQVDKFTLLFPRNGTYQFNIYTTDTNFGYRLEITDVNEAIDKNDETIPELSIFIPMPTQYKGQEINITTKTNEICSIQMGDKVYNNCNYATFNIPCDGTYEVTATDRNGNSRTKSFKIDYMDEYFKTSTTTTTTIPTTTTTTTTNPTTTTTTTTTTIQPTTTTTATTTTTSTTNTTPTTTDTTTTTTATTTTTSTTNTTTDTTTTTTTTNTTTTTTDTTTTTSTTNTTTTAATTSDTTTTTTTPATLKPTLLGDANCDGVVSIADAAAIFQCLANPDKYRLSEQGQKNADVDGKSGITPSDAIDIQRFDAKLIESF